MGKRNLSSEPDEGVALIGFGQHMRHCLLPALRYLEIPVLSVTTRHPEAIRESARRLGIPLVLGDIAQLQAQKKITAAVVATEAKSHLEIVRQLTGFQVPVFVEKPVAESCATLREGIEPINATGVPVMVGFQKRFVPGYRQAKRLVDEKRLGELIHMHYQLQVGALGKGADFLLEVGIHALDLVQFFLGRVALAGVSRKEAEGRRHYTLLLRNERGVSASVQAGEMGDWNQPGERLEVMGTGHRITIDNLVDFTWHRPFQGHGGLPDVDGASSLRWSPTWTVPTLEHSSLYQQGYIGELEHFFKALQSGRHPSPGLQDSLLTLDLLGAVGKESQ